MNKIVEAVKEGRKIETKVLFSVVNDFCLTRLAVKTSDGDSVVSMQVNKCEDRKDEYEFSQTCIGFDDVAYHLKKISEITGKNLGETRNRTQWELAYLIRNLRKLLE